jgi:cadmium resistance protein CadD (predicted permease)
MTDIVSLVTIGISAFVATNIDDIFILMMSFMIDHLYTDSTLALL